MPRACINTYYAPRPVLDDRIDHFGELVKDYYNVEELGDPATVTEVRFSSISHSEPLSDTHAGRCGCGRSGSTGCRIVFGLGQAERGFSYA